MDETVIEEPKQSLRHCAPRKLELFENGILAMDGKHFRGVCGVYELAKLLGLGGSTVRRFASRGVIPAFKLGKSWAFHGHEIERWLSKNRRRFS
jgi:excisionase family DNA binding protein